MHVVAHQHIRMHGALEALCVARQPVKIREPVAFARKTRCAGALDDVQRDARGLEVVWARHFGRLTACVATALTLEGSVNGRPGLDYDSGREGPPRTT